MNKSIGRHILASMLLLATLTLTGCGGGEAGQQSLPSQESGSAQEQQASHSQEQGASRQDDQKEQSSSSGRDRVPGKINVTNDGVLLSWIEPQDTQLGDEEDRKLLCQRLSQLEPEQGTMRLSPSDEPRSGALDLEEVTNLLKDLEPGVFDQMPNPSTGGKMVLYFFQQDQQMFLSWDGSLLSFALGDWDHMVVLDGSPCEEELTLLRQMAEQALGDGSKIMGEEIY